MFLLSALFSHLFSVCCFYSNHAYTGCSSGKGPTTGAIPDPPDLLTSPPPDYHAQNEKYPSFNAEYARHTITGLIILFYY